MQVRFGYSERAQARFGGRGRASFVTALATMLVAQHVAPSFASGDAAHGAKVYQDCMICHSLDKNEIGPMHRDVFGRKAGSVAGYDYSIALKASNIVWNDTTLDKWLTDTESLVPDNDMSFRVASAEERRDIVAYLKSLAQ